MKYDLMTPCPQCPFRNDIKPFIRAERAEEILTSGAEFPCHKTIVVGDEFDDDEDTWGEIVDDSKAQHCAGVLIILEREEQPHQMMRICERLGMYDASKLNMDAPVYDGIDEAIEAHEDQA